MHPLRPLPFVLSVLLSLGLGTGIAALGAVERVTRWVLSEPLVRVQGTSGNAPTMRVATPGGGRFRIAPTPPCANDDANCFVELSTSFRQRTHILVGGLVSAFPIWILFWIALLRFLKAGKSAIHVDDADIRFATDAEERLVANLTYKNVRTRANGQNLRIPFEIRFPEDTHDGSKVEIRALSLQCQTDPGARFDPPVRLGRSEYDGHIVFTPGVRAVSELTISYEVTSNFAFDLDRYRKRWRADDDVDNYVLTAQCYYERYRVSFAWPQSRPSIRNTPWVERSAMPGMVSSKLWRGWNEGTWCLTVKNVEPQTTFDFKWRLVQSPKPMSVAPATNDTPSNST